LGAPLNTAVENLWWRTWSDELQINPSPAKGITVPANELVLKLALGGWALLLLATGWFTHQLAQGRRRWTWPPSRRGLLAVSGTVGMTLIWWYLFYAPQCLPLPLSPALPDIWVLPLVHYISTVLLGTVAVSCLAVLFPQTRISAPPPERRLPPDAPSIP